EAASVWPDRIRERGDRLSHATWHYVNLPYAVGVEPPRPTSQENVVWAIEHNRRILFDPGRSDRERAVALSWVLHLVGDVHQPLHACSRYAPDYPQGDRGGNDFLIRTGSTSIRLHSYWDAAAAMLLDRPPPGRLRGMAGELRASHPRASLPALADRRPSEWAAESRRLAETAAYEGVEFDRTVTQEYAARARKVARERLVIAGYRLADLLNR
ncbi:MAG: S1/P1 nuclease, partial [Candidatus Eremiobacterota bacterium]